MSELEVLRQHCRRMPRKKNGQQKEKSFIGISVLQHFFSFSSTIIHSPLPAQNRTAFHSSMSNEDWQQAWKKTYRRTTMWSEKRQKKKCERRMTRSKWQTPTLCSASTTILQRGETKRRFFLAFANRRAALLSWTSFVFALRKRFQRNFAC